MAYIHMLYNEEKGEGMKRPVLWLLSFLVIGILVGAFGSTVLLVIALFAGLFVCGVLHRVHRYWPVFIFVVFLLLGALRVGDSLRDHITHHIYGVQISGVAREIGVTGGGNQRVTLAMESGIRVMVYIRPHLPWAALGQEMTVTGDLIPLAVRENPGGYNQFQHLRSQKIDGTMWADTVALGEVQFSVVVALRQMRDRLGAVYEAVLPPREAAVMQSIVLGDRYALDRGLVDQYRRMGIFHILSISGLHVGILMMAVSFVLGRFLNRTWHVLLTIGVMVLYCLMTGASPATVRAVTMGSFLLFGKLLGRDYDLLAAAAWACIVLLIYEPLYVFNVGFQLSFVAVFGIGLLTEPMDRLLGQLRVPRCKLRSGLAVNMAAVFSTYPVFAFHFYEIPLYSMVGNMLVAPTTTLILVCGVLVGLVGLVWLPGATFLAGVVYYILRFYEMLSLVFYRLPHAMVRTGGGNMLVAGLGAAVLLLFVYAYHGFGDVFRRRVMVLPVAVVALVIAVFFWQRPIGLAVTHLQTPGAYAVARHRGDVLIMGAPRGGEGALFTYLDMQGVRRASGFILVERPRPQDVARLASVGRRVDVFYLPLILAGEVEDVLARVEAELRGYGFPMPDIVWLQAGNVRYAGRSRVEVLYIGIDGGMVLDIARR